MKQVLRFTNRRQATLIFCVLIVLAGLYRIAAVVKAQNVDAVETVYPVQIADAGAQGSDSLKRYGALKIETDESAGSPRVALASDFDADGVQDLLVAQDDRIVLQRGNINAFAPQTQESWEAIRDGRFVSPFEKNARSTKVPVAADFIFSGDFNRDGKLDAAFAARNDNALYVMEGDGAGNFSNPRRIETAGAITTLAAGDVNRADGLTDLIVGTRSADGFGLQIFSGLGDIFAADSMFYNLPSQAEAIAVGQLNENEFNDIAVGTDSEIIIISGIDSTKTDSEQIPEMLRLSQPAGVKSIVTGDLMPDRDNRTELGVLSPDGILRILARGALDTRPVSVNEHLAEQVREYQSKGYLIPQRMLARLTKKDLREPLKHLQGDVTNWAEAEVVTTAAPNLQLSPQSVLTTGRISNGAADDLIVLDQRAGKVVVMPFQLDESGIDPKNTRFSFDGKRAVQEFQADGAPVAALALKLNYDNEPDLLVLKEEGSESAFISAPTSTYTVTTDTFDDIDNNLGDNVCNGPSGCTLRAAIMEANRHPGNDTIMINPGINPTISRGKPDNDGQGTNDQANGDLDITCVITDPTIGDCNLPLATNFNNLTIMGAVGGNTVSAGTFSNYPVNGGGNVNTDRVFDVGQSGIFGGGLGGSTGINVTFTNLTIQNGNVREALNSMTGGGNLAFGGGIRFDGFCQGCLPHGSLTLNNTTINNNQSDNAGGGVYQVYGSFTASSSTFSSNITKAGEGGGVFFGANTTASNVSITNSTFNANEARQGTLYPGTTAEQFTANADGGGLRFASDSKTLSITNTNFTNNIAQQDGGAIKILNGVATVTGGTMTGNTARRHGGVNFGDQDPAGVGSFLTFSGSTMQNNVANSDNTIFPGPPGHPEFNDGAAGDGGAVFRDRGVLNLTNCVIGGTGVGQPNTATNGGGVAHDFTVVAASGNTSNQTTVTINGGSINGNVANMDGGGIYFNAANFTTTASALSIGATTATAMDGNKAKNNGGGIHLSNSATATLKGMILRSNQANSDNSGGGDGGAFYNNSGTPTFTGTLAIGASGFANSAANGGGIYNAAGTIALPASANISFNSATTNGGGINNAGTINSFSTATINSNSATSGGGIYNTGTITVDGATINSNTATTGSSVTQAGGTFNNTGTNTLGGNLAITGGTFNAGSGTNINLGGNFSFTGGTFTQGSSTFNFNGTAAQSITGAVTFNNLTVNNSAAPVTLNSNETVGGALTLTSGTLAVGTNTLTLNGAVSATSGTLTSAATGTVNYNQQSNGQATVIAANYGNLTFSSFNKTLASSGTIGIAGTFTPGSGTATTTGSTISFNGTSLQTIPVFNYNNLTLNNAANANLGGSVTVGGALALTSGTLNVGTNILTLNDAASQTGGAFSSAASGTVNYAKTSAGQNVLTGNYGNLKFSNFSKTLASSGTVGVAGTFTPNSAANTIAGSTFDFNGAATQTIPAFNYFNLTSSNTGARTLANGGTIGIAGTFTPGTNAYTITGNTIDFNGTDAQTIAAFNYNNLTVSGSRGNANVTFANGTIGVAGVFNPSVSNAIFVRTGNTFSFNGAGAQTIPQFAYNNLTTAGSGTKTLGGTVDVLADLLVGAGTTLDASATNFALNVGGNFTNNGTFTPRAGTVTLNGSTLQTIGGTTATTFNNLTLNNSTGANLGVSATVGGAFTLTAGSLGIGTNTLTLNGAVSSTGYILSSAPTGTVNYNQGSAGQTVLSGTYGNLQFSNFSKNLPGADISIAGTFTPSLPSGTTTNSRFTFNGAAAQIVPVYNYSLLTANNAAGLTLAGATTVDAFLTLQAGIINTGVNILTLSTSAAATRDSSCNLTNCFVASSAGSGGVLKQFGFPASNENFTFPVGTTGGTDNGYSPVALTNATSLAGTSSLTVRAVDSISPALSTQAITRYWQLTEAGNLTTDMSFTYLPSDASGISDPTQLRVLRGNTNVCIGDCVNENTFTGTVFAVTDFSPWTIAAPVAPTASTVAVGGRLVTASGRAIGGAIVSLTDESGQTRRVTSNQLGYFNFTDVKVGDCVINAKHRSYSFAANVLNAFADTTDLVLIGQPNGEIGSR